LGKISVVRGRLSVDHEIGHGHALPHTDKDCSAGGDTPGGGPPLPAMNHGQQTTGKSVCVGLRLIHLAVYLQKDQEIVEIRAEVCNFRGGYFPATGKTAL
jgi:hypothetical protein